MTLQTSALRIRLCKCRHLGDIFRCHLALHCWFQSFQAVHLSASFITEGEREWEREKRERKNVPGWGVYETKQWGAFSIPLGLLLLLHRKSLLLICTWSCVLSLKARSYILSYSARKKGKGCFQAVVHVFESMRRDCLFAVSSYKIWSFPTSYM